MTDITDQDRHAARAWAKNWQGDQDDDTSAAARVILATVDAPALSERLEYRADILDNGDPDGDTPQALRDLADSAAQMEHDLTEARAELEKERDLGVALAHDRDAAREALTLEGRRVEKIAHDRAEARAQVERLTNERDAMSAMVDSLNDDLTELRGPQTMPVHPSDQQSNSLEKPNSSFKSSLKEPAQNPADVKPGEAWVVEVFGERRAAVKDRDDYEPWNTFTAGGRFQPEENESVTLVARLVPAPRTITNADELDALAEGAIIRSKDGDACRKSDGGDWTVDGLDGAVGYGPRQVLPATVLWEPEA